MCSRHSQSPPILTVQSGAIAVWGGVMSPGSTLVPRRPPRSNARSTSQTCESLRQANSALDSERVLERLLRSNRSPGVFGGRRELAQVGL